MDNLDLTQLLAELEMVKATTNNLTKDEEEMRDRISFLSDELDKLRASRNKVQDSIRLEKRRAAEIDSKILQAARLEELRKEEERLAREFAEKSAEMEKLTANAAWRDIAFKYQIEGGQQLAVAKRGILGDKRGLGKTLTGMIWADSVQAKKMLVIAPNDVVTQFEGEIRRFTPNRTIIPMAGQTAASRKMVFGLLANLEEFVITMNYEAWRMDKTIIDSLVQLGLDTIILDEAHRSKAATKQTARGIFQLAYRPNYCENCRVSANFCGPWRNSSGDLKDKFYFWHERDKVSHECPICYGPLTVSVKNFLNMTGTPILNKPEELFPLLFLVNPVAFPTETKFLNDFCVSTFNGYRFSPGGLARLKELMGGFFLQRDRSDVGIDVPPPAIIVHEIEKNLTKYAKQYEAEKEITTKSSLLVEGGEKVDIFFVLELILRQRQCMTWPAGIEIKDPETKEIVAKVDVQESQKLDAAMETLLELVEEGERVIVFSQFKAPLYEMNKRLQAAGYAGALATGDQSKEYKDQIKTDFDIKTAPEKPRWSTCFATFKAFGTGINLNAAKHMIILDDEWNPGSEDQAIGRIDRLNSEGQATVHFFRVKNSVDDFMAGILKEKREMNNDFSEGIPAARLTKFFTEGV